MVLKMLIAVLLPCASLFCSVPKSEIIEQFSDNLMGMDIDRSYQSLSEWQENYPEDSSQIGVCKAFLLLIDENTVEAKRCFENNFYNLKESDASILSLETVKKLFYCCLSLIEEDIHSVGCKSHNPKIMLCKSRSRLWKLKAITGMLITVSGCLVAPFNPPLGVGLIMSGAPMMIQGIEDTLDEHDDIQRELDERRRMGAELDTERSSNQLKPQNNYFPIAA